MHTIVAKECSDFCLELQVWPDIHRTNIIPLKYLGINQMFITYATL